jgi:flagellar L-ring protein precursor FlgH
MKFAFIVPVLSLALSACQAMAQNPLASPQLSPVGTGVVASRTDIPSTYDRPGRRSYQSLWSDDNTGFFRDTRAHRIGDIVTVSIDINDKAQFDNATGRAKTSSTKTGLSGFLGFGGFGTADKTGKGQGGIEVSNSSSAKGEGSIDRSEKLQLSIAAVVTEVLPNGNLLVSGSQEVRVNYEVRVLTVAGIVRPTDISNGNTVSYDKIAEARISYGGRGRITDVQQPGWGQRIVDAVSPY